MISSCALRIRFWKKWGLRFIWILLVTILSSHCEQNEDPSIEHVVMGKWVVVERTVWVDTFSYSIPADLNHDGSYNDFYYEFGEKVLSKYSQFADKSYIFEDIEYFASGDTLIYTHWEGDTLYSTQRVGYQFDNEKLILRENLDWDPAEVINILIPHEGILPPTSWY